MVLIADAWFTSPGRYQEDWRQALGQSAFKKLEWQIGTRNHESLSQVVVLVWSAHGSKRAI